MNEYTEPSQERDFTIDNSATSDAASVSVHFRRIKELLLAQLQRYDAFVGCVAWLTDLEILAAMQSKSLGIVVQKEDFLRPDSAPPQTQAQTQTLQTATGRAQLRRLYARTSRGEYMAYDHRHRETRNDKISGYQMSTMGGVRCLGNHNTTRNPAHPRMHNKFLVFGDLVHSEYREDNCSENCKRSECTHFVPRTVWTGSFNFSQTASLSLENVVLIRAPEIAKAYHKEWANLYLNSEELDWRSVWHAPDDFRVHT